MVSLQIFACDTTLYGVIANICLWHHIIWCPCQYLLVTPHYMVSLQVFACDTTLYGVLANICMWHHIIWCHSNICLWHHIIWQQFLWCPSQLAPQTPHSMVSLPPGGQHEVGRGVDEAYQQQGACHDLQVQEANITDRVHTEVGALEPTIAQPWNWGREMTGDWCTRCKTNSLTSPSVAALPTPLNRSQLYLGLLWGMLKFQLEWVVYQ